MQRFQVEVESRWNLLVCLLTSRRGLPYLLHPAPAQIKSVVKVGTPIGQHCLHLALHMVLRVVVVVQSPVHRRFDLLVAAGRLGIYLRDGLEIQLGRLVVVERRVLR